jgi:type III secretion system low calcium response chaperone LcrH/SycD
MEPDRIDVSTPEGQPDAVLHHGLTPARLAGITPQELEAVYALGYDDLQAGRLGEACERMAFLVQQDPWERRYHLAFAYCLQQAGQWESAGRFYAQALLMDATDAACAVRTGECLEAMGALDEAREAYEAAVKLSWLESTHAPAREDAQAGLDRLSGAGT